MVGGSAGRTDHLRYRAPSVEDGDGNDMDWASETAPVGATSSTIVGRAEAAFSPMLRVDSGYTAEQLRGNPHFPRALQELTDLELASFRAGLTHSVMDNTIEEPATSLQGAPTRTAQHNGISDRVQSQDTQVAELGPRPARSLGLGLARGGRIRSPPTRLVSLATNRAASNIENVRTNPLARRLDHWIPRRGSSGARPALIEHTMSDDGDTQPRTTRRSIAAIPSPSSSRASPSNQRQASTLHDHNLRPRAHLDQIPALDLDLCRYPQAQSSDDDEDSEEIYARYRKKRRGRESSQIVPTAETQRLEEQLMSNLLQAHGITNMETAAAQSNRNAVVGPRNTNSSRGGLNFDAAAGIQNLLGAMPGRESLPRGYNELLLQMAAERRLQEPSAASVSYLPPPLPLGSKSIVFLSELFPQSFDQRKRSALLKIFRTNAPYVPTCINLATGLHCGIQYHVRNPTKQRTLWPRLSFGANGQGWPSKRLPLEVFQLITDYLPRNSLQNMRLVNHEFERKVSNTLFHTVVVAFRPEIYGMMIQNSGPPKSPVVDNKGKGKEISREPDKTVHDGMRTFQGWGPHIKKFAMAFEVEETTLEKPPMKGKFETHPTFWGQYKWPHPYYNRFEFCEGLEKKADEFRCMSAALSNLTQVTELALSIDSGLGWLNGPDISDRAQLFQEKPRIFGKRQQLLDVTAQERQDIWEGILKSASPSQARPGLPNEHGFYEATVEWQPQIQSQLPVRPTFHGHSGRPVSQDPLNRPLIFGGVDIQQLAFQPPNEERAKDQARTAFSGASLIPNALSPSQQEWLLETEWAQRAFISSFSMALSDNSQTFQMVTSLNIARLSSRFLPSLQRTDIWHALKKLNSLTINVSADWRNIMKSETGVVDAPSIKPSTAAAQFYNLLQNQVSGLENIKTLNIGYVGGGEHQTGIYGRNRFILPAPVVDFLDSALLHSATNITKNLLILRHIEDLTLTNCWFTPHMLKTFCTRMHLAQLKTLTFKSISLTSHPGDPTPMLEPSKELGTSTIPQGPPRYGESSVGNFFDLRPDNTKDPRPDGWVTSPHRIGSWPNVIDCVTPGANLDFVRYAYQYYDEPYFNSLKRFDPKNLESITFESCGYVCLTHLKEFRQTAVGTAETSVPPCLAQRALDLTFVTMDTHDDKLLGQIVPSFPSEEAEVLETGFPMRFGWADQTKAAECLEDGQPLGGSGRFSGKVQRLTFPEET